MAACCLKPANYKTKPDPYRRPGYVRVECAVCGRFIGHHDAETEKRNKGK